MEPVSLPPSVALSVGSALPKDLKGACRALAQEFVTLVFQKMREAMVPKSSQGSSGFAMETTQSMLDAQWAQLCTRGDGLGLWKVLYEQLKPRGVKSGATDADEKGASELQGKGVAHQAYARGNSGTLGQRFGRLHAGGVPVIRQESPGLVHPPARPFADRLRAAKGAVKSDEDP